MHQKNNEFEELFENLAKSLIEHFQGSQLFTHADPFESYCHQLKLQFFSEKNFTHRFMSGYRILLEMQRLKD